MTLPMPLAIYMDVHVPAGVSEGLRRKQLDVRTAREDSAARAARTRAGLPRFGLRERPPPPHPLSEPR